jgi:hypothetical protein
VLVTIKEVIFAKLLLPGVLDGSPLVEEKLYELRVFVKLLSLLEDQTITPAFMHE